MAALTRDLTFPIFKFLCREGSNGLYIESIVENLSHSSSDLPLNSSYVRRVINDNSEYFYEEDNTVYPKTSLRICGQPETHDDNCTSLHLCKFYLLSDTCTYSKKCVYGHNFKSQHNMKVLKKHGLLNLSFDEVRGLLQAYCNRTPETTPFLCVYHNKPQGCRYDSNCHSIHICKKFLDSVCQARNCNKNHNIDDEQVINVLEKYGFKADLDDELIDLMKRVAKIEVEEVQAPSSAASPKFKRKHKTSVLCRYYLREGCIHQNCKFIHAKHPYMWRYFENEWHNFPEQYNQQLEKQFADPNIKDTTLLPQYKDIFKVYFETMLASKPDGSYLKIERIEDSPSMNWVWYWRTESETWIEMSESGIEEENKIIEKHSKSSENLKLHFKESNTYAILDFENMVLTRNNIEYPVCRRPKEKE